MAKHINKTKIAILLATYNGERFMRAQMDSVLKQTNADWTMYIHDDGSTDGTLGIISEYVDAAPSRFVLIDDGKTHLGPRDNFMHLLSCVDSSIYMFCDQDDIWFPNKIDESLRVLENVTEAAVKPVLVYTNMKVCDADDRVVEESFWTSINHNPNEQNTLNAMSYSNYITGCTMLFNNAAKEVAFPMPSWAPMHDWWVSAMVYKNAGIVKPVASPTMLYRKHGGNATGDLVVTQAGKSIIRRLREMYDQYTQMCRVGAVNNIFSYLKYKKSRRQNNR